MSRAKLVTEIKNWLNEYGLNDIHGVLENKTVNYGTNGVICYDLSFCLRGHTDGTVKVYSPKKFVVEYITQNRDLPHNGSATFTNLIDLYSFLVSHFVFDKIYVTLSNGKYGDLVITNNGLHKVRIYENYLPKLYEFLDSEIVTYHYYHNSNCYKVVENAV